ncbi:hypothetical protein [Streptomyces africanus]|uniref:hypothetical protein n=1 Tax=Streptomyces africanus TaxID=231024 RepID=UPI000A3616CE|nr:hypothetical protein [Streptomyces africanus]
MTIDDIAAQLRDTVHTGVADGKNLRQLDDDIAQALDGLTHADIKAVHAHIHQPAPDDTH